jgi:ribose transport system permease protein
LDKTLEKKAKPGIPPLVAFIRRLFAFRLLGIFLALLLIIAVSSLLSENFLSFYNMTIIIRSLAFVGLVALGQTILLLLGDIDLSVGAVAGLSAVIAGTFLVTLKINPVLSIIITLILGTLCGVINGTIITKLRLNSLVVTLGMMGIYKGLNLVITKGQAITSLPESVLAIAQDDVFGLPVPFFVMVFFLICLTLLLSYTPYGRYVYATGCNRDAARIIGIKTDRIRIISFALTALLSCIAGVLMMARMGSAQPQIGDIWLMSSIASPVIGGTALTGGLGSPLGAIIGAAIIGVVENIIVIAGVSPYWQTAVSGAVVVLAVSIDSIRGMLKSRVATA